MKSTEVLPENISGFEPSPKSLSDCLRLECLELELCYKKLRHLKSLGCTDKNSGDYLFFLRRRSSIEATVFSIHDALHLLKYTPESANQ